MMWRATIVRGSACGLVIHLCALGHAGPPCNDEDIFSNFPSFDAGLQPVSVAFGDLNGDGAPDLAVANQFSDDVSVLLGIGDGTFQTELRFGAGFDPRSIAIGDLDGDGIPDLVVANRSSHDVSILLGIGGGLYPFQQRIGTGDAPQSVAIGDLNGDGAPDLAVANSGIFGDAMDDDVSVLLGNGDGTFQAEQRFGAGDAPQCVAIGDLNGDGIPDLAVANSGIFGDAQDDDVSALLGNGDGTFQAELRFGVGDSPRSIAIDDLNGDGALDLAVANGDTDDTSVLLGNGDGTFQTEQRFDVGEDPQSVAIGDLDGNGAPDLVLVNQSSDDTSVLLGNGDGTFRTQQRFSAGDGSSSVAIGDLDGDGAPDLAVANFHSFDVSIQLANGDGSFRAKQRFDAGDEPFSVAIGDFNGDGAPDLAVANSGQFGGGDDVSVLLGNDDGTFQIEQRFDAGDFPQYLVIEDFNSDGSPDLAIANSSSNDVSVLLSNGDGTFQTQQRFSVGDSPRSIASGDLNGDGASDLAVANRASNDVSALLGNGDGTFQTQQRFGVGALPESVAAGDFDGDGTPDLAVTNLISFDVSVLLGNGDGTFQTEQRFSVGNEPASVAIDDLDANGTHDLAVANRTGDDVSVLLGNGDGTFQTEQRFIVGDFPVTVAIGDLDGDGDSDLAVANRDTNDVSVLIGNGDGTFQTQQRFTTGSRPRSVAIGNLDGDGTPDLVAANFNSGDVSVLLNATLATTFWTGNAGQIFTDSVNWAGAAPSIGAPNFAVFDASVPPGGFDPVENVLLPVDVSILGLAHANQEIQVNLFGNDLVLLGDPSSSDGPLGLELGVEQCGGMDAFPPVPPTFRLDNGSVNPSTLMTPRATIGRDGPAVLEINGGNGAARLNVVEDLIVGDLGDGAIVLRTDDAVLNYGTPIDDTDSLIIGDRATGMVDVMNGASVSAAAGLGRFLLGRAPGSEGMIRIDGAGSEWEHLVLGMDDLSVGENGHGVVEITDGGRLSTQFGTIALARFPGSSADVTIRGPGSIWFDPIAELIVAREGEATVTVEDGGALDIFSGITNGSDGVIQGNGMLSEVVNLGEIIIGSTDPARGNAPGTLTVIGDFDQFDDPANPAMSGRLLVDLFDTGGSIGADTLTVTGDAGLAGGLIIDSAAPLEPSGAAAVSVLNAGAVNGRFDVAFFPAVMPDPMTQEGRFLRLSYPSPAITGPGSIAIEVATLNDIIDVDEDDSFDAGGTATFAASGDFDGDGDADLALAIPDGADPTGAAGVVTILTNGTVEGSPTLFVPAATVSYTVGRLPTGLVVGEFDGVSGLDIAVCNRMSDDVNVLTNDGFGLFAVSAPIGAGDAPSAIASSDFDGNGLADLVVTNAGDADATVLLNTSSLTGERVLVFTAVLPDLPTGPAPSSVDPLDVDNGKDEDDIVIANAGDGTITVYPNSGLGDGSFGPPITIAVGIDPRRVRARDLNLDGFPEIVTSNRIGDSVSVVVNNGDGTFAPSVHIPGGDEPSSIAVVDLDGDADQDLALVTRNPSGERVVSVLRNDLDDGQIAFAPSGEFLEGTNPIFVVADDFDGDAMADLITVNETTGVRGLVNDDVTFLKAASSAACPGDCDGSGAVDFNDLVAMLFEFGEDTPACDADGSGSVDFNDLVAALFLFGTCP